MSTKRYTQEFKVEAVKLVTEQGRSVAEAARSLGIGETLLRSWKTRRVRTSRGHDGRRLVYFLRASPRGSSGKPASSQSGSILGSK